MKANLIADSAQVKLAERAGTTTSPALSFSEEESVTADTNAASPRYVEATIWSCSEEQDHIAVKANLIADSGQVKLAERAGTTT